MLHRAKRFFVKAKFVVKMIESIARIFRKS